MDINKVLENLLADNKLMGLIAVVNSHGVDFKLEPVVQGAYDAFIAANTNPTEAAIIEGVGEIVADEINKIIDAHPARRCVGKLIHRILHVLTSVLGGHHAASTGTATVKDSGNISE